LDSSGALLIIDQQLAHRRVLYENCLKDAYSVDSQALLVPIHLDFSPAEADFLNEYLPDLNQIGISIRSFGKQSFIIDSMPSALAESDVQALMLEIIGSLHQFSKESHLKKQKNKQAALAASKAAIFKNTQLSVQEAEELIKQLFACSNPLQCPQGKTIVAILKPDELKKKFQ
jgi:DNA mismatch repair protein MutL